MPQASMCMRHPVLGLFLAFLFLQCLPSHAILTEEEITELRNSAREMFYHGFDNYMKHGFPHDEVRPVSCQARWRGCEANRGALDDTLGNYSLTLVDSLDTLAVLGDRKGFKNAIDLVEKHVSFDTNIKVSLFEVTIRVLGGLLSGHTLATDPELALYPEYNGVLLRLARDLGNRLLPAFQTPTRIPVARIHLQKGIEANEAKDTCTAGAGTLLIEFGVLSRLTGDPRYEDAAKAALLGLWSRRSSINLVGHVINVDTGRWVRSEAGIGAGMDSFFEYLLKAYVLFGDKQYLDMFNDAYDAVMTHVKHGPWYRYVDMQKGKGTHQRAWIDSLQAFWPGLQVLKGDVEEAVRTHTAFYTIWRRFGLLVEGFNVESKSVHSPEPGYPLRPELVESTYLLHHATGRNHFLQVGKEMMQSINTNARVKCGYAVVHNVPIRTHEDRMDSFFLSETVKYLYLLFDKDNFVSKGNFVFSTEGHIFRVTKQLHTPTTLQSIESAGSAWPTGYLSQCLVTPHDLHKVFDGHELAHYEDAAGVGSNHGVLPVIPGLHDKCIDPAFAEDEVHGEGSAPPAASGKKATSDTVPGSGSNIGTLGISLPDDAVMYITNPTENNKVESSITGVVQIKLAETAVAYTVTSVNGIDVARKSVAIFGWPPPPPPPPSPTVSSPSPDGQIDEEQLNQSDKPEVSQGQCTYIAEATVAVPGHDIALYSVLALFGPALPVDTGVKGEFTLADPLHGCHNLMNSEKAAGKIVVVERGQCLFLDKVKAAQDAGALAVVVITRQPGLFAMGGMLDEIKEASITIPSVMISPEDGEKLEGAISEYHKRLATFKPKPHHPPLHDPHAPVAVRGGITPGLRAGTPRPASMQGLATVSAAMHGVKLVLQNRVVQNVDVIQSEAPEELELCVLHGKEHEAHLKAQRARQKARGISRHPPAHPEVAKNPGTNKEDL